MTSLADFLLARLDEDEAAAKAAAEVEGAHWHAEEGMIVGEVNAGYSGFDLWDNEGAQSLSMDPAVAAFAAIHDPARVLAECTARRRIVERAAADLDAVWHTGYTCGAENGYLEILELLAQPYRDHPDFDPAWSVAEPLESP